MLGMDKGVNNETENVGHVRLSVSGQPSTPHVGLEGGPEKREYSRQFGEPSGQSRFRNVARAAERQR